MIEQRAELDRFRRDAEYYRGHHEELLSQHPEEWVAIFDQTLVASAPDFDVLLADLDRRGVPADQALVNFVTRNEDVLILASR
jgi:Family of unknown function (DUF5678)